MCVGCVGMGERDRGMGEGLGEEEGLGWEKGPEPGLGERGRVWWEIHVDGSMYRLG